MTFVVMAPEHPLVDKITKDEQRDAVNTYAKRKNMTVYGGLCNKSI